MAALDDCQDSTWAGLADWRLPSTTELHSIVDNGRSWPPPAIDPAFFPGTPTGDTGGLDPFWSSSTHAARPSFARWVDFSWGHLFAADTTEPHYVRCVRDGT